MTPWKFSLGSILLLFLSVSKRQTAINTARLAWRCMPKIFLRTTTGDKRHTNVFIMYTMYRVHHVHHFYHVLLLNKLTILFLKFLTFGVGGWVFFQRGLSETEPSSDQNSRISSHGSPRFSARVFADFVIFKTRIFPYTIGINSQLINKFIA